MGKPQTVYSTRSWYSALEEQPDVAAHYVVTTGEDGTVLGILPAFLHQRRPSPFYDPGAMFGEVLGQRGRWWPALVVGNRSTCNELLLHPRCDADERHAVLDAQARALRGLARSVGAEGVVAMYLAREQANTVAAALGADESAVLAGGVDCEISVPWPDFDTYLAALDRRHRYRTRKELRIFAGAGLTTSVRDLGEVLDVVSPLMANLDRKHGSRTSDRAGHDEVAEYVRCFPETSLAFLCEDSAGRPVGCSVWLRNAGSLYCRFFGFDYSRTGSYEYFSLMLYEPIRYATGAGVDRIHLGLATRAKLRRQVTTRPLYAALWRPGWDTPSFTAEIAAWNSHEQYLGLD